MKTCTNCKHYYITWDKKFPYGCRAMGFKSHEAPSLAVYKSSGIECLLFESKNGVKKDNIGKKQKGEER